MHLAALHPGKTFTQNEFLKETSQKKYYPLTSTKCPWLPHTEASVEIQNF